jgi:membrane-bound lytic murein transglycosylase MltF
MASTWSRAIATAKLFLTVASSAWASEYEAVDYVRRVRSYQDRQQLEERLRREGDTDAAAWVSRNS